jgi:hypothetical protein
MFGGAVEPDTSGVFDDVLMRSEAGTGRIGEVDNMPGFIVSRHLMRSK